MWISSNLTSFMKKIVGILIGVAFLFPVSTYAQIGSVPIGTEPIGTETQYNALVQQLIEVLLARVEILQAQLADLTESQEEVRAETKRIADKVDEDVKTEHIEEELPEISLGEQSCTDGSITREVVVDGSGWTYGVAEIFPEDVPELHPSFNDWVRRSIAPDASNELPGTRQPGVYKYKITLYHSAPGSGGVEVSKNKLVQKSGETSLDCQ